MDQLDSYDVGQCPPFLAFGCLTLDRPRSTAQSSGRDNDLTRPVPIGRRPDSVVFTTKAEVALVVGEIDSVIACMASSCAPTVSSALRLATETQPHLKSLR
jgi:hypothetical protein